MFHKSVKSAAQLATRADRAVALIPMVGDNFAIVDAWLAVELYPGRATYHVLPDGSCRKVGA
jgi:predicted fused transcriptional regulator/phosphomethylpyrimidine kinase